MLEQFPSQLLALSTDTGQTAKTTRLIASLKTMLYQYNEAIDEPPDTILSPSPPDPSSHEDSLDTTLLPLSPDPIPQTPDTALTSDIHCHP